MCVGNKGPNCEVRVQVPGTRLEHTVQGTKVSSIRQIYYYYYYHYYYSRMNWFEYKLAY